MVSRFKRPSFKATLSIVAIAILVGLAHAALAPAAQKIAWPVYDLFQRATALKNPSGVVFVVISEGSLSQLREAGTHWPWPREFYGAMVKVANATRARSIAFDMFFPNQSMYGIEDDRAFNAAIKESRIPVILAGPDGKNAPEPNKTIVDGLITGTKKDRLRYGVVTVPLESDGTYRRMPVEIDSRLTFSSVIAFVQPPNDKLKREPLPERWLRFYDTSTIPYVEVSDIFDMYRQIEDGKEFSAELKEVAKRLTNKNWIVGASAPGLLDLKPLPTDPHAPAVLVHLTAAANQYDKISVQFPGFLGRFFDGFLVALVAGYLLFLCTTPTAAMVAGLGFSFFGSIGFSALMWSFNSWTNPISLLLTNALAAAAVLTYRFQAEWKDRQKFVRSIENSMSPQMVEMIRRGDVKLTRYGEDREITVMFSDLSGFTTVSERLKASDLVDLLNLYLDEVVDLTFRHAGYVDKFIGDAVMSIWGAPIADPKEHAKKAIECALEFSAAVDKFNRIARDKFGIEGDIFSARVGVHTGAAIVGNVGSHSRYNYTAIGDTVNLASRLEGIGKAYNSHLTLSEESLRAAGRMSDPGFLQVDVMAVKGRSSATTIYTYVPNLSNEAREAYEAGRRSCLEGRFSEAIAKFETALKEIPQAKAMIERCRLGLDRGSLPALKNGVWHHDEK